MSTSTIHGLRDLSDEDVRLLYDIVNAAEASKSPPYRALFAAYDKVLAQRGISKEHDQVYLRFLLRMGEGRKEGQGLFDQFELLLEKLGFRVAFDGDENPREDASEARSDPEELLTSTSPPRLDLLQTNSFRPARRASFDSAYETINDSKPLIALPVRPNSVDGFSRRDRNLRNPSPLHDRSSPRGRLMLRNSVGSSQSRSEQRSSTSNTNRETYGSDETLADGPIDLPEDDILDIPKNTQNLSVHQLPVDYEAVKQAMNHYQDTETHKAKLEGYAGTLRYHQTAAHAVRVFRSWCDRAQQAHVTHHQMNETAIARDADILQRQAFDQWRICLQDERHRAETQRFHASLARQATKARDMYLLTKAFTHWAQSASDEVSRRSEARSRMLQTRYFKAWRDITAVNELKVRRQILSKFLLLWTRRAEHVDTENYQAHQYRNFNLVSQRYRKWFWQFCERRAPAWYTSKLQQKLVNKWSDLVRDGQEKQSLASEFRSIALLGMCLSIWMKRSNTVQEHDHQAVQFRRRALLVASVEDLQRNAQLGHIQSDVTNMVKNRLLRSAMEKWSTKTVMALEASKIDKLRMTRLAWVEWNSRLRCQVMTNQINDRLVMQALYKWVLAERLAVCERASCNRVVAGVVKQWLDKLNAAATLLGRAKHLFEDAKDGRSLSCVLKVWSTRTQAKEEASSRAGKFRCHALVSSALSTWKYRTSNFNLLDQWSNDARFYVLASHSLKTWHVSTIAMKKRRRRAAFSAFSQTRKTAEARKILSKWHSKAQNTINMNLQADNLYQQSLATVATRIIFDWQQSLLFIEHQEAQATGLWVAHLLLQCFQVMVNRVQQVQASETNAAQLDTHRIENTALASLRKLNWNAFQVKRHHESADSLLLRTQRKHFRDMLRFWANTAKQRQQQRDAGVETEHEQIGQDNQMSTQSFPPSRFSAKRQPAFTVSGAHDLSQTASFSATSRHPTLPLSVVSTNPTTPGYLRTPSRRTTASRLGTHTPATSTITPFMNRLFAHYPSVDRSPDQSTFSSSTRRGLRFGLGFEDIPESKRLGSDDPGG